MLSKPKISVVVSIYNGSHFLEESFCSILNQTFPDFEIIAIDDCSTDNSLEILNRFKSEDNRIRIHQNQENLGLTKSLNLGLELSQGQYIARMDADDICLPKRFEKQFQTMQGNPDLGVCGSWINTFGSEIKQISYPSNHEDMLIELLTRSPFAHPSVMMRKSVLSSLKLRYNEDFKTAQDSELWVRLSRITKLVNIPEVLLNYRIHDKSISLSKKLEQSEDAYKTRYMQYEYLLKRDLTNLEKDYIKARYNCRGKLNFIRDFFEELYQANLNKKFYAQNAFCLWLTESYLTFLKANNLFAKAFNKTTFMSRGLMLRVSSKKLVNRFK